MTKVELLHRISTKTNLDYRKCEKVIDAFADEIMNCLADGEKIILKNFVTFEITQRPERQGRNPQTGDVITYPAVKSVKVRASQFFKDLINRK